MTGIKTDVDVKQQFTSSAESEKGWKIRFAAEPVDLHLTGVGSKADKFLEDRLGVTAGPGSVFNHNYIEIMNPQDEVVKRVHGIGLDENWEMSGKGRLVGFIVDGKYTKFSDDPIQKNDSHATKPNQFQHVDHAGYSKIVFEGTERQVMQLYGGLVRSTIEINRQGPEFGLLGQKAPNSNSFSGEMKEKLSEMGDLLGLKIKGHDAPGWDIGSDFEMNTRRGMPLGAPSMSALRQDIDGLEKQAAHQLKTIHRDINVDLKSGAPAPAL